MLESGIDPATVRFEVGIRNPLTTAGAGFWCAGARASARASASARERELYIPGRV